MEKLAGEGTSETIHREFGVKMYTDPSKVYFNPRLSSERARISSLVCDGEIKAEDVHAGEALNAVKVLTESLPLSKPY